MNAMNETNPESSPSLADCFDFDIRQREEGIRLFDELHPGVREKQLNDRAMAAAEALICEFHVGRFDCFRYFEFHNATHEEVAAILRPFLQPKQIP